MAQAVQWPALQKILERSIPPTLEDLQKFSSGDMDPWTLTLGQALCERFKFAPLGHRNIGSALHNLLGEQFSQQQFEIGYGSQHIIHLLLRTGDGVALAAIVGVLAEYFQEDFVVDFFMLLAKRSNVPESLRPLERQWRRVVQVLYGVLAISTFGQCSMLAGAVSTGASGDFDLDNVLGAMEVMSQVTQTKEKGMTLSCGPEVSFLAAAATWLFDLKYRVQRSDTTRPTFHESGNTADVDVIFKIQDVSANVPTESSDPATDVLPNYRHSIDVHGNAGRVPFERIFQTTFGTDFTRVKDETLSAYIAGAARMMQDNLDSLSETSTFGFLSHRSDTNYGPGFGFVQTMLAWFPELRRLSPRLERISKLSADESKARFVQAVEQLQTDCQCPSCNGSESSESRQVCLITMLELVISLGVYVTRMIVSPRLYPKVKGIWNLYNRLFENRMAQTTTKDPIEHFMRRIGRPLPTSVDMLKMGALLFTNSRSREIEAQPNLMGITHAGLTIFLNGSFKDNAGNGLTGRGQAALTIRIVPGWMCLIGHEAKIEVHDQWSSGWTFEEMWNQTWLGTEAVQMFKWKGDVVLSCLIPRNESQEAQSEAQGWLIQR